MKQSINKYAFIDAFNEIRPYSFSYEGLKALYEYLTEFEDESGGELELDVIAFCCDFSEYETVDEFLADYGHSYTTFYFWYLENVEEISVENWDRNIDDIYIEYWDEYYEELIGEIRDKTACIPVDENAFIIQCY